MIKNIAKELNSYPVLEFEQLHRGHPIKLYNGVVNADELIKHSVVPVFNSVERTGYQRPPSLNRLNSIASYVLSKGGVMPTSILVNIREGAVYEANGKNSAGTLSIPHDIPWYVVDGQHREGGLELAGTRKHPLPYALPVVFSIGLNEREEMDLFRVVNSTQKSVSTDLVYELLGIKTDYAASIGEPVPTGELRRACAVTITRTLTLDSESTWYKKIRMADEARQGDKTIREAAFCRSLDPLLGTEWAQPFVMAQQCAELSSIVNSFWDGLRMLAPEAIADPKTYTIQGPTGVWLFGWVLRDFIRFADKADDWSPKFFAERLRSLEEWVESATWHKDTGDDLAKAKGAGVARVIYAKVRPSYSSLPIAH